MHYLYLDSLYIYRASEQLMAQVLATWGLSVAFALTRKAAIGVRSLAVLHLAAELTEVHPANSLVVARSVVVALLLGRETAFIVRVLAVLLLASELAEVDEALGVVISHTSAFAVGVAEERCASGILGARRSGGVVRAAFLRRRRSGIFDAGSRTIGITEHGFAGGTGRARRGSRVVGAAAL